MMHVAIDLGARQSQICVRKPDGEIESEKRMPTKDLPDFFDGLATSRVILETCSQSARVARAASACGHEVRVVPDVEVDNFPHATFRGEDRQLDAAIHHLLCKIAKDPRPVPEPPPYPDKSSPDNRKNRE